MKVVLIVGPFVAPNGWLIERNIRRAEGLALAVWTAGAAAICPHTNTRFFFGTLPETTYLEGYREILSRCDAVITVPGWEESNGSKTEIAEAARRGIPVFSTIEQLKLWLTKETT